MNTKNLFRAALAACALFGAMLPVSSTYAGTISIGGSPQCGGGSFSLAMDPSGNLAITCSSGGAPVCTLGASSTSVTPGSSVTLTANCSNSPTSYAWTNTSFASNVSSGIVAVAATTTYSVQASNGAGAGNVASVTVTASTNPVPSCTLTANPATITAGQNSTLTASCNNGATAINWTIPAGGPSTSGTGGTYTFGTAGSYTYSVTGTNGSGTGGATSATVVVSAAGGGGGCTPTANVEMTYTSNGQWRAFSVPRGGVVALGIPLTNATGKYAEFTTTQTTGSQPNFAVEISVSTCPGDPVGLPGCKWFGSIWGGASGGYATTSSSPVFNGYCQLTLGTQYYLNVRDRKPDGGTTCTSNTCAMIMQYNGNLHLP